MLSVSGRKTGVAGKSKSGAHSGATAYKTSAEPVIRPDADSKPSKVMAAISSFYGEREIIVYRTSKASLLACAFQLSDCSCHKKVRRKQFLAPAGGATSGGGWFLVRCWCGPNPLQR